MAFVGAGFSAAAKLPGWAALLRGLASEAGPRLEAEVRAVLERNPDADGRYLAAQLIEDTLGRERLLAGLRERLNVDRAALGPTMARRVDILRRIPFRAILTTNYDHILGGEAATRGTYVHALRPQGHRWWEHSFWLDHAGPRVLCIHGDLGSETAERGLVLTRRDYRRRLYQDPGYTTFLRTILSTRTVLYLGFSFTDAYLNELRSEVLSLLDFRQDSHPVAYAVVADAPPEMRDFYRQHEGIELLDFETAALPEGEGRDFSGFDRWLEAIYDRSSPRPRFARALGGKRVLWLDPYPENNMAIRRFFESIAQERPGERGPVEVDEVASAEEARDALVAAEGEDRPYDLVISHWGSQELGVVDGETLANGPRLLVHMRRADLRVPVVVFSSRTDASARKRTVLGLGATAYCHDFETFFRELESISR